MKKGNMRLLRHEFGANYICLFLGPKALLNVRKFGSATVINRELEENDVVYFSLNYEENKEK